jgi:hypothetical protein
LVKSRELRFRTARELADALSFAAPVRRRWFARRKPAVPATLFRARLVAELAIFSAALKAIFKWTLI